MTCKYTQLVPEDMIVIPSVTLLFAAPFRNMNVPTPACLLSRRRTGNCLTQSTGFQTHNGLERGAAWKIECRLERRYCTEIVEFWMRSKVRQFHPHKFICHEMLIAAYERDQGWRI